jgi:hypothetical protein
MRCSASCLKKAEVRDLIWRLQPIDGILYRLLALQALVLRRQSLYGPGAICLQAVSDSVM